MFNKIAIVGASGNVGSHIAFLGAMRETARDIFLLSIESPQCKAVGLDVSQAAAIFNLPIHARCCETYDELKDCEVVIIAAGFPRKTGMKRADLFLKNAHIIKEIAQNIAQLAPNSLIIIVSNPVDTMCLVAKHWSGFEKQRIIGMAGILDGARLAYESKLSLNDFTKHIKPYVLGAHNDDMLPLLKHCTCEKASLADMLTSDMQEHVIKETKRGGVKILNYYQHKSAYFAPAAGVIKMLELIDNSNGEISVCSVYAEGEYNIKNIYIGLPVKLGRKGVEDIIELPLDEQEQEMLNISVQNIKKQVKILQNNGLLK